MASLRISPLLHSPSLSLNRTNCTIFNRPKLSFFVPKASSSHARISLVQELDKFIDETPLIKSNNTTHETIDNCLNSNASKTIQLYAILEAVADRIEMHQNVGEQRDNWNNLLLNSINMITLTATTMAGVMAATTETCDGSQHLALKLSSALLFSAATGMLLVMNKIQPSQLAEEQRNAARLFKQLRTQIETRIAIGKASEGDVRDSMEKVLALDRAYPLPLLGAMLEKFPKEFEGARWWPKMKVNNVGNKRESNNTSNNNGWSVELENEMKEVVEVVKRKDMEDYERLGNLALKVNKALAISGPLLSSVAAFGCVCEGSGGLVAVLAGALVSVVNAFEHGGQVGMVFEMYRNCSGFFQLLEENIKSTVEEDVERREDGELYEMKIALQLGRSVSELRELASKSTSSRSEGGNVDEFASKLF